MIIDTEKITLILAIYGATLSTLLFVNRIRNQNIRNRRKVKLWAMVKAPYDSLKICIANNGFRPVTITSIRVEYGTDPRVNDIVLRTELEKPITLKDSSQEEWKFERQEIQHKLQEQRLGQHYYKRLWAAATLSTGEIISCPVEIDYDIIKNEYVDSAKSFIASDLFLGFPQMESLYVKKYPSK